MKLRHPSLIRCLGLLGGWAVRWWTDTLNTRIHCEDGRPHPTDPQEQRYIYAFWHEVLLGPVALRPRAHILISEHADGELITQVCRHLKFPAIRGSSTRGGTRALLEMIRRQRDTHIAFTPDGPRGPRRQVQPGLIYLASKMGLPIVPTGIGYARAWRARSWDRFALPLPWTLSYLHLAPPVVVPPKLDRDGLELQRRLLEREMHRVTELAELRATGQPGLKAG